MSTVPGWCGLPSQFFSLCFVGKIPLSVIMTDLNADIDSDLDQNYSLNSNADPKNMQELTVYVSSESRPNHRPGTDSFIRFSPVPGAEPPSERSGQVPIHVGSNYRPNRRHGQPDRRPREEHCGSDDSGGRRGTGEVRPSSAAPRR